MGIKTSLYRLKNFQRHGLPLPVKDSYLIYFLPLCSLLQVTSKLFFIETTHYNLHKLLDGKCTTKLKHIWDNVFIHISVLSPSMLLIFRFYQILYPLILEQCLMMFVAQCKSVILAIKQRYSNIFFHSQIAYVQLIMDGGK